MPTETSSIIKDIGELWKLGLVGVVFTALWFFRRPIERYVERLTAVRLKRGESELEFTAVENSTISQIPPPRLSDAEEIGEQTATTTISETTTEDDSLSLRSLFDAFDDNDFESAEIIYHQFISEESSRDRRQEFEAVYLHFKLVAGDSASLEKLKQLEKDSGCPTQVAFLLAYAYEKLGKYKTASEYYLKCFRTENDFPFRKCQAAGNYVRMLGKLNQIVESVEQASKLSKQLEPPFRSALWQALADVLKSSDVREHRDLRIHALVMSLEDDPVDQDRMFSLAHAASEHPLYKDIALLHYSRLASLNPTKPNVHNNLGVLLEERSIRGLSNDHYAKSWALGNTLAASNLASNYIHAGFLNEAHKILDDAITREGYHPNVASSFQYLTKTKEEEKQKLATIITEAEPQDIFMSNFSKASLTTETQNLEGPWFTEHDHEAILIEEEGLSLKWSDNKYHYSFVGLKFLSASIGTITQSPSGSTGSDSSSAVFIAKENSKSIPCYIYLEKESGDLQMMIADQGKRAFRRMLRHRRSALPVD